MNGDGRMDLVSGSYSPGDVYWFEGSQGGFKAGRPIPEASSNGVERSASAAYLADWNGDGKPDLLVGNISGEVHVALNEGTADAPRFGARKAILAGGKPMKVDSDAHPLWVDWDGDGARDMLVGSGEGHVFFFRGTGKHAFAEGKPLQAGGKALKLGLRTKIAVADWNRDGKQDLLVGNFEMLPSGGYAGNVYVVLRK